MREIAPGLYYWTAAHPSWDPVHEPESPGDWPEHVGRVLFEGPAAVVLIDPLVPEERWGAYRIKRRIDGAPGPARRRKPGGVVTLPLSMRSCSAKFATR